MFSNIRRYLGVIKVTEQADFVIVSGLPASFIDATINRIWNTSKIATNMFNRITSSQIVFHRFFVPDVIYTLQVVMNDKRARSNVRIIQKVIDEIYENTWAKSILEDPKPFLNRDKLSLFHKKPLPHQNDFFDVYESNTQRYNLKGFLLGAAPGSGKAHSLDTVLRSPNGDIKMKDVKVGDVLYDRFFRHTKVTGVFPQGNKPIYKFILEDNRYTEVCLEHLWKVYYSNISEVINTESVKKLLESDVSVYIDLPNVMGLAESKRITERFKEVDKLLIAQSNYRKLGAVTTHTKTDDGNYELSIEFRADNRIKVKAIEYLAIKPAQCISVDNNERLYIVDDYIVTHNTLMATMLSRMLETDTNIFLVPKNSLDRVWKATIENEIKEKPNYWISNGNKPLDLGYKDYIIHHDHISKVMDFFNNNSGQLGRIFVNLDESHYFNELKSQRTLDFITLSRDILNADDTLSMSGTPLKAIGSEAIPTLKVIDPYFNDKVADRFLKIYGKSHSRANDILQNRMGTITFKVDKKETVGNELIESNGYVSIPNGSDYTLDNIRAEMKKFITERMAYYKKEGDVYAKVYHEILDMHKSRLETSADKAEFNQYNKAVDLIRKQYDPLLRKDDIILANKYERYRIQPYLSPKDKERFKDAKSVYKYYFLKVQGEALGRILGKMRVQCNVDILNGLDKIVMKDSKGKVEDTISIDDLIMSTKKKTLMFTSFVEVVKEMESKLKSKGYNPLVVYGETNKDLANIIAKFASDDTANPLIATYKSLSTAVPLTMANVTVMLNTPFRDYEKQQAVARTDRLGQDSTVYITTILLDTDGKPNISTRSKDIMDWSKQQVEEIMGFKVDDKVISIESNDDNLIDTALEDLAEKLDMGVDVLTGEYGDKDINPIEADKDVRKNRFYNAW